jgi:hypothetical protein
MTMGSPRAGFEALIGRTGDPGRDFGLLSDDSGPVSAAPPSGAPERGLATRVAALRAQLAPIRSRSSLADSYRRESRNLLNAWIVSEDDMALEIAHAVRWSELESDSSAVGDGTQ